jgi:hypothetical protein
VGLQAIEVLTTVATGVPFALREGVGVGRGGARRLYARAAARGAAPARTSA